jgi:hypothetical protein
MIGKRVHTNIKQTTSGQTLYFTASTLQHLHFGDFAIVIFLFFYNAVLQSSSGCIN